METTATVRVPPAEVADWHRYFEAIPAVRFGWRLRLILWWKLTIAFWKRNWEPPSLALTAQLKEIEQGFFDLLARRPDTK